MRSTSVGLRKGLLEQILVDEGGSAVVEQEGLTERRSLQQARVCEGTGSGALRCFCGDGLAWKPLPPSRRLSLTCTRSSAAPLAVPLFTSREVEASALYTEDPSQDRLAGPLLSAFLSRILEPSVSSLCEPVRTYRWTQNPVSGRTGHATLYLLWVCMKKCSVELVQRRTHSETSDAIGCNPVGMPVGRQKIENLQRHHHLLRLW
jgi:hypothetical protein